LWVANTHAYCNSNAYCYGNAYCYSPAEVYVYADAKTAWHAAASALRLAFNDRFLRGLASLASPRNAYFS